MRTPGETSLTALSDLLRSEPLKLVNNHETPGTRCWDPCSVGVLAQQPAIRKWNTRPAKALGTCSTGSNTRSLRSLAPQDSVCSIRQEPICGNPWARIMFKEKSQALAGSQCAWGSQGPLLSQSTDAGSSKLGGLFGHPVNFKGIGYTMF